MGAHMCVICLKFEIYRLCSCIQGHIARRIGGDVASTYQPTSTVGMSTEETVSLPVLTLKSSKEIFVSHHSGTHVVELCLLVALVPLIVFLLQFHRTWQTATSESTKCSAIVAMLPQFAFIVVPAILAVMSEALLWPLLSGVLLTVCVAACWTLWCHDHRSVTTALRQLANQGSKRLGRELMLLQLRVMHVATQHCCSAQLHHICAGHHPALYCHMYFGCGFPRFS